MEHFRLLFPKQAKDDIQKEWCAFKGEGDIYSPRVDVAVGPFATGDLKFVPTYHQLMESGHQFIETLLGHHHKNGALSHSLDAFLDLNQNARCLLAVEIENRSSRKHLMGSSINAAMLGRVGLIVAWRPKVLESLIRQRRYLDFIRDSNGQIVEQRNALYLTPAQLASALIQSVREAGFKDVDVPPGLPLYDVM